MRGKAPGTSAGRSILTSVGPLEPSTITTTPGQFFIEAYAPGARSATPAPHPLNNGITDMRRIVRHQIVCGYRLLLRRVRCTIETV
jgi:hypothetical protein